MSNWERKFLYWIKKAVVNCRDTKIAQEGLQLLMDYSAEQGPLSTTIGGFEIDIEVYSELVNYLKDDYKIKAIKKFREATGSGLKEAKESIEDLQDELMREGVLPKD